MHCNLRPPEPRQSFFAIIATPCHVWSHWTYPLPHYSVFAADTLLVAVILTSDLEHLQCIACDVMKLCTKFECNRAIRGRVIAISIFDLMTLNMCCARLWGNFHQVWPSTTYPCLNSVFMLIRYVTLWPWHLTSNLGLQHFECQAFTVLSEIE